MFTIYRFLFITLHTWNLNNVTYGLAGYLIERVSEAPNSITKINAVQSVQFTFTAGNIFILLTNRTFRRTARKVHNNMIGIAEQ